MARRKGSTKENSAVKEGKNTGKGNYAIGYGKPPKGKPFTKGDPRINYAGRKPQRVLSEAYRARLSEVDPDDPEGRTFAMQVADAQILVAKAGSTPAATELRKATEGDTLNIADAVSKARRRMVELGLTDNDIWERDPALAGYFASIGAIGLRAVPDGEDSVEAGSTP